MWLQKSCILTPFNCHSNINAQIRSRSRYASERFNGHIDVESKQFGTWVPMNYHHRRRRYCCHHYRCHQHRRHYYYLYLLYILVMTVLYSSDRFVVPSPWMYNFAVSFGAKIDYLEACVLSNMMLVSHSGYLGTMAGFHEAYPPGLLKMAVWTNSASRDVFMKHIYMDY